MGELKARVNALVTMRTGPKPLSARDFCDEIDEVNDQQAEISQKLFRAFTDAEIFGLHARRHSGFHLRCARQGLE